MAVFNAQLQTAVSLQNYANLTGDADARSLAAQLRAAVQKALPQVDTGYWTRYTIGGFRRPLQRTNRSVVLTRTTRPIRAQNHPSVKTFRGGAPLSTVTLTSTTLE